MNAPASLSTVEADAAAVGRRVATVRARVAAAAVAAGRDPGSVRLVAVTKGVGEAAVRAAQAAGVGHFGENRVPEAELKVRALADLTPAPTWHLVGHLQRNKAKRAVALFHTVDSVDSVRLAVTLDRLAAVAGRRLPLLLEVNVTAEAAKHGVHPAEAVDVARQIAALPSLVLQGLMTVGPLTDDRQAIAAAFRGLAALRAAVVRQVPGLDLDRLSMGMSGDYDLAVAAGATEVRIGRALFADEGAP